MRRLLVTGGAGFIGSNFVQHWLASHRGGRLVVLDALTYAGNISSLEPVASRTEFRFVRGDICDEALVASLLYSERLDTIVHFAAESHVDRSIAGPDAFVLTNVVGTHSLLKAARQVWLQKGKVKHRFHHVSTDEVYGSLRPTEAPFTEGSPYAPNSPYAASKASSDHLVRAYHHTYGLDVTISNCSNNYGPYHFPEKLIPLMIVNILNGVGLPVYGDGRNVRDWLFVADHCRGLELILEQGRSGEVYNIGGRAELENIELVRQLCDVADRVLSGMPDAKRRYPASPVCGGDPAKSESLIRYVTDRPGHDRRYAIDCSKIENELGFRATTSISAGLIAVFEWFVNNETWWRPLLQRRSADAVARAVS